MRALVIAIALCGSAAAAHAYPQFQISKEQQCVACHIAPAGGGLLDGMGAFTAEDIAMWPGDGNFLHGAVNLPEPLLLGGDIRGAAGLSDNGGGASGAIFPMQLELYGAVRNGPITVYTTLGAAIPKEGEAVNALLLREHWVMYRSEPGSATGLYVRAGRFMPVYGLRYAEHIIYTRRYGGTPLYGEAYGVNAGYLSEGFEVHATGFIRDRLRDDFQIERGDGAALYAEKRLTATQAIGAEFRYAKSPDEWRAQGGMTGKFWLEGPKLQIGAELQLVRQKFDQGASRNQLVGYVMGSWQRFHGFNIDVGLGHYDEDLAIKNLDRDAIDVNVHWFAHSHIELVLMNRLQMLALGSGGDTSFYTLLQLHYRI